MYLSLPFLRKFLRTAVPIPLLRLLIICYWLPHPQLSVISEVVLCLLMASHPVTCPPLTRLFLPIVIPTSPCFWCHVLHGVDGWSDSSGAMWDAIGQRQRNSYYLHLSVIYFSSVRLKMAARDGDKPVWPAKHCPLQIPLFIHKLDPLGLRGRLVRSVDPCDVCVWVVAAKDRVCACMETFVNLG